MNRNIFQIKLIAILLMLLSFNAKSQYVTIPDSTFAAWLSNKYPLCMLGNQLDTTCNAILNETTINVFPYNFANLDGIQYFKSLKRLDVSDAWVYHIPSFPPTLEEIEINNNQLDSIPDLPPGLLKLNCNWNNLNYLPNLPSTLNELECGANYIDSLPVLPPNLNLLNCSGNMLDSLPTLPGSLFYLYCSSNKLKTLPSLPQNLQELNTSENDSMVLQSLPNSIRELSCVHSKMDSLPPLPNSLQILNCMGNNLGTLPPLPNSLKELYCSMDSLTSLPTLPPGLEILQCQANLLTSLPAIPSTLYVLFCYNNQITSMPLLPDTMPSHGSIGGALSCSNNQIECFENIPYTALYLDNNPFTCLPNYPLVNLGQSASLFNYPLCSQGDTLNNSSGCKSVDGIFGTVFLDDNQSCSYDILEDPLSNVTVNIYDTNNIFIGSFNSLNSGHYNFALGYGSYIVEIDTSIIYFSSICTTSQIVVLDSLTPSINLDFGLICNSNFDIVAESHRVSGWVFPGQQHTLSISGGDISKLYGGDCANGESGTIRVEVSSPANYVSVSNGSLTPNNINNNVFDYFISDFSLLDFNDDIGLVFEVDTTAQIGDSICVSVEYTANSVEVDTTNNKLDFCYDVINSYDPNNKLVFPSEIQYKKGEWLYYTINFQNTGTAPAFNIRITDTLSGMLELETIQMLSTSHNTTSNIKDSVITFYLNNIMLVDSNTNLEDSKGYVQFKIRAKKELQIGTEIENEANIYFDYNSPILTNLAHCVVVNQTEISENEKINSGSVEVYPNPSNSLVNIRSLNVVEHINIYDMSSRLVMTLKKPLDVISIRNLNQGVYFLEIITEKDTVIKKVVKK